MLGVLTEKAVVLGTAIIFIIKMEGKAVHFRVLINPARQQILITSCLFQNFAVNENFNRRIKNFSQEITGKTAFQFICLLGGDNKDFVADALSKNQN